MSNIIVAAIPGSDATLVVRYQDGSEVEVDFTAVIDQGGVFESLADPTIFRQVTIGEGGRFLEWPGGLDFCADALRLQGIPRPQLEPSMITPTT
jgi:hypothetical protein